MVYDPFEDNDDDGDGELEDIDPEFFFLGEIRGELIKNCKYYYSSNLYNEILPKMSNSDLSIFHLNIRSIPKIFDTLLPTIHASGIHFNLISLSETWLRPSNVDCYGIQGYAHEYLTRGDKAGGGVSIFINDQWTYKVRNDLNFNNDDIELLWVEINKDSANLSQNVIVGTVYRRPGSNPTELNTKLNDTITTILAENKKCIHSGDYNINLLNSSTHPATNEFTELNFSHSLFPVINKPTRITSSSATLIDNIFIDPSDISNSTSGILLWDISDHFPVFHIPFRAKI
jgi:exonuclease III